MPNYCYYEMKVKGSDDAIEELISMMNYNHPTHHFHRVFEADVYERGEGFSLIYGDVAWSINSAMLCLLGGCESTGKEYDFISNVSRRLQLEIEIFSSEPGIGFQEHYIFNNGKTVLSDCIDYSEYCFDELNYNGDTYEEKFAAFLEDNELSITPDDLDENGNYCIGGVKNFGDWTI